MNLQGGSAGIQELRRIEGLIRSDIWNRYVAKAQRSALVWWQQRSVPPGVKARFTMAGVSYYGYGRRSGKPYNIPPYYKGKNGILEQQALKHRPRTSYANNSVTTRLFFGGQALNVLNTTSRPDMRGVVGWTRQARTISQSFAVPNYTKPLKDGTAVKVTGYTMTRQITIVRGNPVRGGDTYAQAFGRFTKDIPVISARVAVELRRLVNRVAYKKNGDLRRALLRPLQEGAA